mmetsp:Transcript_27621/g.43839  ORF Transcript_27621/g.43839 Transcript_27621/m.43839 type:complete len:170 (+) Transcript_27621:1556-2065(+)
MPGRRRKDEIGRPDGSVATLRPPGFGVILGVTVVRDRVTVCSGADREVPRCGGNGDIAIVKDDGLVRALEHPNAIKVLTEEKLDLVVLDLVGLDLLRLDLDLDLDHGPGGPGPDLGFGLVMGDTLGITARIIRPRLGSRSSIRGERYGGCQIVLVWLKIEISTWLYHRR